MISVVQNLRRNLQLFVAATALVALSLISNVQLTAAAPMQMQPTDSEMTAADCATYCARTVTKAPEQAVLQERETEAPDPTPVVVRPYNVQFQNSYTPRKISPSSAYSQPPSRPPDIVALANLRF